MTASTVANFAKALEVMDNDETLFEEIVQLYFSDAPTQLANVTEGMAEGDAERVYHAAHVIKGMAGLFAATHCVQAATQLEHSAKQGQLIPEESANLVSALSALDAALRAYTSTPDT